MDDCQSLTIQFIEVDPSHAEKVHSKATFWNDGFLFLDNFLIESEIQKVMAEIADLQYRQVFEFVYSDDLDPHRWMADIDIQRGDQMHVINELAAELHSIWKVGAWSALKSTAGGENQQLHRDYPSFETTQATTEHDWVQASLLIALQDNTKLIICPRVFGGSVNQKVVKHAKLSKGDALLFCEDLH